MAAIGQDKAKIEGGLHQQGAAERRRRTEINPIQAACGIEAGESSEPVLRHADGTIFSLLSRIVTAIVPPPQPALAAGEEQLSEKSGFAEMLGIDRIQKRVDLLDDCIQA
jgi:hypothetical protein